MRKKAKRSNTVIRGTPLSYNASQQLRYKRKLAKLTRAMIAETKKRIINLFKTGNSDEFFDQQKQAAATDASITSQANKLMKSLIAKFDQLFSDNAKPLASEMTEASAKSSETSLGVSLKQLSGGVTLNTGVVPAGMEEVAAAIINENVSLIKSIPQEYLNDVSGAVMRSITTGNGLQDLVPALTKYSGETERRVNNLALDQTRKAYNTINKQRMQAVGVKKFEWLHTAGSQKPRQSHIAISGNIYSFDDLPLKGEEGFVNGQFPGQAINCLVGETLINLGNGCDYIWRYFYEGDVITLEFDGTSVTSTPNHPFLTARGWLAAKDIQTSDYLVQAISEDRFSTKNNVTKIETFFENLLFSVDSVRGAIRPASHFNFHGDVPDNSVQEIRADLDLTSKTHLAFSETIENQVLAWSDRNRLQTSDFEISTGSSGRSHNLTFLESQSAHSQKISLAPIADSDVMLIKDSINNRPRDSVSAAQVQYALPGHILGDDPAFGKSDGSTVTGSGNADISEVNSSLFKSGAEVIRADLKNSGRFFEVESGLYKVSRVKAKSISKFNSHVYTIQTKLGWYDCTDANVISKNCRCIMIPVVEFNDGETT